VSVLRVIGGVACQTASRLTEIEDESGILVQWFKQSGAGSGSVVVIRLDRFIFALEAINSMAVVTQQARQQLVLQMGEHRALSETIRDEAMGAD